MTPRSTPARPSAPSGPADRAGAHYRRLLRLYPEAFRKEFGEEMVHTFREMRHAGDRGLWMRLTRDLLVSLAREHGSATTSRALLAIPVLFLVVASGLAILLTGNVSWVAAPLVVLFVMPTTGFAVIRNAWTARRPFGEPFRLRLTLGLAAFVPAVALVVLAGDDREWLVAMGGGLALIAGSISGVIWAAETLARNRRAQSGSAVMRRRAHVVIAGAVLAVGGIAAASYNSYRNSQPPPGDHSVANASADSRALWEAAYDGDVLAVERLVAACADPFVQFSGHGLTDFRARSAADHQRGGWGNTDPVPEAQRPPFERIVESLQAGEDTWTERCRPDEPR